ncbi:hypothetical protein AvCA_34910 [Azotobacter vinelandii CA]|uniref:Uncharacterized protein n=2 Tax=Azotobacter vinelandii TaxID=354 RepID=C1DQK4_AZOVD|nr:hypothetical protein Avin_34910 [Azotobacter vinelandii DJ]AGK16282.1 hypothetical protein AvCA_34910 [Azotobacter vinelandii CA]AGK21380.1 hypothetical protein AvCA6_34910 [Azotobacter vinelandii CA6]
MPTNGQPVYLRSRPLGWLRPASGTFVRQLCLRGLTDAGHGKAISPRQ